MLRCNLNFYSDSSNLTVTFSQVFEQARGELSELGGYGRIVGRNKKCSRAQAPDPSCAGERAWHRFNDCALKFRQVLRAAGEGA